MKIAFMTLGCKVNAYETEKMKEQCEHAGYEVVAFSEKADIYVVNTCTVTNIADRKSRKLLHRARRMNPDALVVAAGCYAESAEAKGERDESIDLFLPNREKEHFAERIAAHWNEKQSAEMIAAHWNEKQSAVFEPDSGAASGKKNTEKQQKERTRAFINIQNGCNQYCTYCIIPYVRGELSSRDDEDIIREVRQLAGEGFQEIVITGIHLSSFGVDRLAGKIGASSFVSLGGAPLLKLLEKLAGIPGIRRIRLGSLEPRIMQEGFIKELSQLPQVCPHFHLSLQSGCDSVLERMNRHYTAEEYLHCTELLRKYYTHPAVTTDIIVGFPGESEEEFEITCDFARKAGFADIHVFPYSRRQGTVADGMEGQLPESVKSERSQTLIRVARDLGTAYRKHFIGQVQQVLTEEPVRLGGKDYLTGYNERYARIALPLSETYMEKTDIREQCNQIISVQITGFLEEELLVGEPV